MRKDNVCIIDIDGTLSDCSHRLHHIQKDPKDWDAFFAECDKDTVIEHVRDMVEGFKKRGFKIYFFTARPAQTVKQTIEWLRRNTSFYNHLLQDIVVTNGILVMRSNNDRRDDDIPKKEMLDMHFPDRSVIHCVLEDRPRIIRMYRAEGLKVIDCGNGVEF